MSQTTKRIQVSTLRLTISHRLASAIRIGTHGLPGILKERSRSGRFLRMIGMEMATSVNADSVPMFTMSDRMPTLQQAAISAMTTPTMICRRTGVPCLPVWLRPRGSSPSRLMANTTRVRPSSSTMTTVAMPMTMPRLMIFAAQSAPTILNATANDGSDCLARSL